MPNPSNMIVVTDFDGTITEKDIGNELCKFFIPEKYSRLKQLYSRNELSLRDMQQQMWTDFPCNRATLIEASLRVASLRPGVNEFLELCAHKNIPVYIASCGMDFYIEIVMERFLSSFARAAIKEWICNKTFFDDKKLTRIEAPSADDSPDPLHKGLWAKGRHSSTDVKIIAIGNGGSDRTFIGHVDHIFATEKLIQSCVDQNATYTVFHNFFDILKKFPKG